MNPLAQEIAAAEVPEASVRLWWLGQAGFAFKTPSGRIVFADPYLSDAVERLHGFKRLSLAPLAAGHVRADIVVLTHEHTDHLDPDALPVITRNNPQCRFAGPDGCREGLRQAGVAPIILCSWSRMRRATWAGWRFIPRRPTMAIIRLRRWRWYWTSGAFG